MDRKFIRNGVTALSALVITAALVLFASDIAFAGKKVQLSSKKLDIVEGDTQVLKLAGARKNVKWSIKNGKGKIVLKNAKQNSVQVYGKKEGSASVQAKFKGNTYICQVQVSAIVYQPSQPEEPQPSTQPDGTGTTQPPVQGSGKEWNAVTGFGLELLQNTWEKDENVMVSPVSVFNALAMTANGAKGETLAQLEKVFGLSLSESNNYMSSYNNSLPSGSKYKLSPANSIWMKERDDFIVEQDFLDKNKEMFNASVNSSAFDSKTVEDINNWVSKNTDGMIEKIIEKVPDDVQMYLINALAFDAEWKEPYNDSQVMDGIFTKENGKEEKVELMYSEEDIYIDDEDTEGFIKYYADSKYAFVALLPKEGISMEDYVKNLDSGKLDKIINSKRRAIVNAAVPKFESEFETSLNDPLKNMGVIDAFDSRKADFTGIGSFLNDNNLYIDDVLHKTFIKVDEKGTKAGAVTAVVMAACSSIVVDEIKTVYLDRPFVYMIADCQTWLPAFIGVVQDI